MIDFKVIPIFSKVCAAACLSYNKNTGQFAILLSYILLIWILTKSDELVYILLSVLAQLLGRKYSSTVFLVGQKNK